MTNEINPNRGGPIHSAPDTLRPRLSFRGRTDHDSSGTYRDCLQAQIEHGRSWESAHVPEVELGRKVMYQSPRKCGETCFDSDLADGQQRMIQKESEYQYLCRFEPSQELGRAWLNGLEFGG